MPKVGMKAIRTEQLISAAIQAIDEVGFCEVTVSQIARRAGLSTALAHHYFGSKDQLIAATMRHLLTELGEGVLARLRGAETPQERIQAIVEGNFAPTQMRPEVYSAWLAFYLRTRTSPDARRLFQIYSARLCSNIAHALSPFLARKQAREIAELATAMIDGIWLHRALKDTQTESAGEVAKVVNFIWLYVENDRHA